ncbi:hypothetical protein [Microcoleus sp. AT13-A5]|uniref:hypothetical protein n=1 Tax=Microcoleus sp. AT13-A5 TaxID=2818590 RepID=UPI002FD40856
MTEPYVFTGTILPERAPITLQFSAGFRHFHSGVEGTARVSIVLNQLAVHVSTEHEWDIFDLRNVVLSLVQGQLAMVGYLLGHAYEVQLARAISLSRGIDRVFGIDVPCVSGRCAAEHIDASLAELRILASGENGIYISRCFEDLRLAMKNADDTAFYCYRALESLRHHCALLSGQPDADKKVQWELFRKAAACEESSIRAIKSEADPLRHGAINPNQHDRAGILTVTWDIVGAYVKNAASGFNASVA